MAHDDPWRLDYYVDKYEMETGQWLRVGEFLNNDPDGRKNAGMMAQDIFSETPGTPVEVTEIWSSVKRGFHDRVIWKNGKWTNQDAAFEGMPDA